MGQTGMDVQLSEAARKCFPYSTECKNRARMAIYQDYQQACENADGNTPLLVVKQNQSQPLVVIGIEDFFRIISEGTRSV